MMTSHNLVITAILTSIIPLTLGLSGCNNRQESHRKPLAVPILAETPQAPSEIIQQLCPESSTLVKINDYWTSRDQKWKSYTQSSASQIAGFIGAQWEGIKIGKMICLYKTTEQIDFNIDLEPADATMILEPTSASWGWNDINKNHKICKSANVADCNFEIQRNKDVDPYQAIAYDPRAAQGSF